MGGMGVENRQTGVCGSNSTLRNVYLKFLLGGQIPMVADFSTCSFTRIFY